MKLPALGLIASHVFAALVGAAALKFGGPIVSTWMPEARSKLAVALALRARLAQSLRDPDSLKVEKAFLSTVEGPGGGTSLCGEANAKNGMGGYVGMRRFVVTEDMGPWVEEANDSTFKYTWAEWCEPRGTAIEFPQK